MLTPWELLCWLWKFGLVRLVVILPILAEILLVIVPYLNSIWGVRGVLVGVGLLVFFASFINYGGKRQTSTPSSPSSSGTTATNAPGYGDAGAGDS